MRPALPLALAFAVAGCAGLDPLAPFFDTDPLEPRRVALEGPPEREAPPEVSDVPDDPLRRPSRMAEREELERDLSEDAARSPQPAPQPPPAPVVPETSLDDPASTEDIAELLDLPRLELSAEGTPVELPEMSVGPDGAHSTTVIESGGRVGSGSGGGAVAVRENVQVPALSMPAAAAEPVAVIHFAHGSVALDARDREVLAEVARLHAARGGGLLVVGHASSRTQPLDWASHRDANLEISERRAESVARALESLGVSGHHIRTEARGDSTPVYHEFMETGEAGNRRAEIYLLTG